MVCKAIWKNTISIQRTTTSKQWFWKLAYSFSFLISFIYIANEYVCKIQLRRYMYFSYISYDSLHVHYHPFIKFINSNSVCIILWLYHFLALSLWMYQMIVETIQFDKFAMVFNFGCVCYLTFEISILIKATLTFLRMKS